MKITSQNRDVVQTWIQKVAYSHSGSPLTGIAYRHDFELFCKYAEVTPEQIIKEYDEVEERVFKHKYGQIIGDFIASLVDHEAPKTIIGKVAAVKSFFKYKDLPLCFIPTGKDIVKYHNRDITKDEIKLVIGAANVRERAFYAFMVQSGLRPDTIVKLQLKDIEPLSKVPCKVNVPQEKTKGKYGRYFTFIGPDAIHYLQAYLDTRPKLTPNSFLFASLTGSYARATKKEEKDYNRSVPSRIFKEIATKLRETGKLDYEKRLNRKPSELRLYTLRKYFRKMAGQAGGDYCNFWMGHRFDVPVDQNYFNKDPEFHRKIYAEKAMPFLRLESALPDQNQKVIEEQGQKIQQLEEQIATMKAQAQTNEALNLSKAEYDDLKELLALMKQGKVKISS